MFKNRVVKLSANGDLARKLLFYFLPAKTEISNGTLPDC